MVALELDRISKSFGQVQAVNDLSVIVEEGRIYGFLGPNGAGKTTTLRMITNIFCPDQGKITLLDGQSPHQARNQIGYMPEERGLYRKLTVRRLLSYFASLKGLAARDVARQVSLWLDKIELSGWAEKKVEDLSRGMHQKLQFAVTVINSPSLLILDEPFSGLDPLNYELMKKLILDLRDQGKTILFSTHNMHEAETMCDSILLINKGRKVLDGPLSEIRNRYQSNSVLLDIEGSPGILESFPMTASIISGDHCLEVGLQEGYDPQDLLAALAGKVRVRRFEVKSASLHEIFIRLVGGDRA